MNVLIADSLLRALERRGGCGGRVQLVKNLRRSVTTLEICGEWGEAGNEATLEVYTKSPPCCSPQNPIPPSSPTSTHADTGHHYILPGQICTSTLLPIRASAASGLPCHPLSFFQQLFSRECGSGLGGWVGRHLKERGAGSADGDEAGVDAGAGSPEAPLHAPGAAAPLPAMLPFSSLFCCHSRQTHFLRQERTCWASLPRMFAPDMLPVLLA